MLDSNEESNLDIFFKMVDFIEDDISEMSESQMSKLGGYECLVISLNHFRLYCGQVGIKFSQIEDHYSALEGSKVKESFWNFDIESSAENIGEVEDFTGILGEIETSLAAFEQRCKKTKESFDEWNCVLIMYCYLRRYYDESKTNYVEIMNDILKLD